VSSAGAVINTNSPQLPPDQESLCDQIRSQYVGVDVHALFPNGIDFSQPRHFCFRNGIVTPDLSGEIEQFESTVEGVFT